LRGDHVDITAWADKSVQRDLSQVGTEIPIISKTPGAQIDLEKV